MNQTPELTIDPVLAADFRTAMRRIASSVTLVTGRDLGGNPHGMAASAVIPVSMDPPSMLVSANQGAGLHSVVQSTGKFCVNLLGESHLDLLLPFSQSSRRTERFASGDWYEGTDSLLYLSSAPAAIFCELDHHVGYGTHTLFIGRVTAVRLYDREVDPLVWFNGASAGVSREVALA
ncbi:MULTISPECIES: flavin reductase family protein [Paraburkholderia]|jgi:flavin reductase (DIM6/NTAB) family NADH-FMN oxidoreductase RutF|uniref:flavin reductase family protein n=1 Tax=Paraburkholderia TaxID=1822464 RepID=UPI0038B84D4D